MTKLFNLKKIKHIVMILSFTFFCTFLTSHVVQAASIEDLMSQDIVTTEMLQQWLNTAAQANNQDPLFEIGVGGESVQASSAVQMIFLFTLIGLAPTLLIMMTSFTRIIVVLHFLRSALGTQQMPPNQILIGLALFLTFFLMGPIFTKINDEALQPYFAGEITQGEVVTVAMQPLRRFMLENVRIGDLGLFADLAGESYPDVDDIPLRVLVPAFILTELTMGFIFGFVIFIPFIVIDMVVASVLMAMGMMMLPPAMISTPFKIILFVMVDGWAMIIDLLVRTFRFT